MMPTLRSNMLWPIHRKEMDFCIRPDQIVAYEDPRFERSRAELDHLLSVALRDIVGQKMHAATLARAQKAADKAVQKFNEYMRSGHGAVQVIKCKLAYVNFALDIDIVLNHSGAPFDAVSRFHQYFSRR